MTIWSHTLTDTAMERTLAPEALPLAHAWTTTHDRRRYALSVTLAGLEVAHGWELVALDDVEAANARDEGDEGATGPGWYLAVPGHDLSPCAFMPDTLPASPLLSALVEEYAAKLEALNDAPMPDHLGRRPRRRLLFPTDDEPPRWLEAADCVDGVLVDPELPERASEGPEALTPEELELWEGRPYVLSITLAEVLEPFESVWRDHLDTLPRDDLEVMRDAHARRLETVRKEYREQYPDGVSYVVECLGWGVVDRPQHWGTFAMLAEALECARTGPPWVRGGEQ